MVETCFFSRAKTEQCQRELTSVACLASNDQLLPDFIPRFRKEIILNLFDNVSNHIDRLSCIDEDPVTSLCDRFTEDATLVAQGGKPIGCFKDSFKDRFLGTNS